MQKVQIQDFVLEFIKYLSPPGQTLTGNTNDAGAAYAGYEDDAIKAQWAAVLPPENILLIEDPKAIADVILGVLALSGGHDLDEYMAHMSDRGQGESRRAVAASALGGLASSTALARLTSPLSLESRPEKTRKGHSRRL